jgi:hypothetical protein
LSAAGDGGQVMIPDDGDLSQELTRDTPPMGRVATPARAEPKAQFAPAIQSGESPIAEAARWFSAVADVARPSCVHR